MNLPYSLEALLLGRSRSIQSSSGVSIVPDVVISEYHDDVVTVTQHPVDSGAPVSDHAICQPATVTCVFGWSDSSRLINSVMSGSFLKCLETTKEVYEKLLKLKDARELLSLSTGKRTYPSVLITQLKVTTTAETESSAIIEVTFQEVRLATAKSVTLASLKQKNAKKTAGTRNGGSRSLIPIEGARFG